MALLGILYAFVGPGGDGSGESRVFNGACEW